MLLALLLLARDANCIRSGFLAGANPDRAGAPAIDRTQVRDRGAKGRERSPRDHRQHRDRRTAARLRANPFRRMDRTGVREFDLSVRPPRPAVVHDLQSGPRQHRERISARRRCPQARQGQLRRRCDRRRVIAGRFRRGASQALGSVAARDRTLGTRAHGPPRRRDRLAHERLHRRAQRAAQHVRATGHAPVHDHRSVEGVDLCGGVSGRDRQRSVPAIPQPLPSTPIRARTSMGASISSSRRSIR